MNFEYPKHFIYPETERIFFIDHINTWETILDGLKNKSNTTLEIGALYGGSSVYILERFCKIDGSKHYVMDINKNDFIVNNLKPYGDKVKYLLGESADSFKVLNNKDMFDLIYIDGNHMSKYVLEDAVNAFYYLKNGGYIIFDDYGGGLEQPIHLQAKTGVDAFYHGYHKHLDIIYNGYQVFMRKKVYINEEELKSNYYK